MAQPPQYSNTDLLTEKFIAKSIECFRANVPLGKDTLLNLIQKAKEVFESQPALIEINIEKGEDITVCGDIHGDYTTNCYVLS